MPVQTRFETNLNGAITDVQTTAVFDAAPAFSTGYGTFERGTASEEDVYWGGVSGLQLTGLMRGLSKTALTITEVAGNKKAHADNATFEATLLHYIVNNKADLDEAETITAVWTFSSLPESSVTPTTNDQLSRKGYVDTGLALKANLAGGNTFSGNQVFADNTAQTATNAAPNAEKVLANKKYVDDQIAGVADSKVKATALDNTSDELDAKLTAGTYLSYSTIDLGGGNLARQLDVSAVTTTTGSSDASKLISTASDGFLDPTFRGGVFMAYENITAGQSVALLPIEVQFYTQLTNANLALGDSNTRRRHAVKIVPSQNVTITDLNFRAAEAVNGATTVGNLIISIQTDASGDASGVNVTNATATISQATQRTWTTTQATRVATFAGSVSLVAGTTYHIVWECSATDATNYLNLGVNSSHDESYLTFTRRTYNLDTLSWGNTTTNATPFFWGNTQTKPFGMAICPTDASWGGRTWNFLGFARSNITAFNSGVVLFDSINSLSGLEAGVPYYLSETPGAITKTAPEGYYNSGVEPTAFTYRIGTPYSTTGLNIRLGTKRVAIIEQNGAITATTTRNYLTWFKPEFIRGSGTGTGNNDSSVSIGVAVAGGTDMFTSMQYIASGNGTATGAVGDLLNMNHTGSNDWDVEISDFTNVGFTATYTETGTALIYTILEAYQ